MNPPSPLFDENVFHLFLFVPCCKRKIDTTARRGGGAMWTNIVNISVYKYVNIDSLYVRR